MEWFINNLNHPYPSEDTKIAFSIKTKLSQEQINNWFKKKRLKFEKMI